jgi:hypothetical protein
MLLEVSFCFIVKPNATWSYILIVILDAFYISCEPVNVNGHVYLTSSTWDILIVKCWFICFQMHAAVVAVNMLDWDCYQIYGCQEACLLRIKFIVISISSFMGITF